MKAVLLGIFLGGCAWSDGHRREVDLRWLGFWGVVGGIFLWMEAAGKMGVAGPGVWRMGGLLTGIFLLAAAAVSKGQVGAGDGLAFLVSGLFLNFGENSMLLFGGLVLLAVRCFWAVILNVWKGKKAARDYPLLPYVFAAYILYWGSFLGRGGIL